MCVLSRYNKLIMCKEFPLKKSVFLVNIETRRLFPKTFSFITATLAMFILEVLIYFPPKTIFNQPCV